MKRSVPGLLVAAIFFISGSKIMAEKQSTERWKILAEQTVWPPREPVPPPAPPNRGDETFTLALPGLGGEKHQSLFARMRLEEGAVANQPNVRSWVQQRDLQPSHLARQTREMTIDEWTSREDGSVWARVRVVLRSPEQREQDAVAEEFELEVVLSPAEDTPDLRLDYSTPSWRRLDLPLEGRPLAGSARGTHRKQVGEVVTERTVDLPAFGARRPELHPGGPWVASGDARITYSEKDGSLWIKGILPGRPADADTGGVMRSLWSERQEWSAYNALLVEYESPAIPGGAFGVAVEESPGTWYEAPRALPLQGGRQTVLLPFSGLKQAGFDTDHWFTPRSVGGLAFLLRDGRGLAEAEIRILRVEAVLAETPDLPARPWAQAPPPVEVSVDFSTLRQVNGWGRVRDGLFGVHVVGVPEEEEVWEVLRESGIRSIRTIMHAQFTEPYTDGNIDRGETPAFVAQLGGQIENDLVECWTWGGLFSFPFWAGDVERARRQMGEFLRPIAEFSLTPEGENLRMVEIFNEPFMWARHINRPDSPLEDPGQHGSLPGPLATGVYVTLFNAAAEAMHAVNPALQLGGPSSTSFSSDDWRHLEMFVLPLVEGAGDALAFVAEHHYGGRGQQYAAEFEVFQAAATALTGRRIPVVNTECNDLSDTPGAFDEPLDYSPDASSRRRAIYQVEEILSHLRFGPDHATHRAIHALWKGKMSKQGEASALRLMRDLRGDLVVVEGERDFAEVVASREGEAGVLLAYNAGPWPREFVVATRGGDFLQAEYLHFTPGEDVTIRPLGVEVNNRTLTFRLPPLSAAALRFATPEPARAVRKEEVFFARGGDRPILWDLVPGENLAFRFPELEGKDTAGARFVLRWVADPLRTGEATLHGKGVQWPLPGMQDGPLRLQEMSLPATFVPGKITLRMAENALPGRLASLALVKITEEERPNPSP